MLCRRWQREVILRAPDAGRGGNAFLPEGRAVAACVQPLRGALARQMRLMLCGRCADLSAGDGVCVDVPPDADPDFRVVWAARWPGHWEAHLRWIPPPERGADA